MRLFLADSPEVLASLPVTIRSQWQFMKAGRLLCDAAVAVMIRAMATKTSWSAIASAINEMRSAEWAREVQAPYIRLCEAMNVTALLPKSAFPVELRLTDKCVQNIYMKDFDLRRECVRALIATCNLFLFLCSTTPRPAVPMCPWCPSL